MCRIILMDKLFFLTLTHFVTDFILQGWGIGQNKRMFNKYMLLHVFITSLSFSTVLLFFETDYHKVIISFLIILVSHLTIDVLRQEVIIKNKINTDRRMYWILLGLDQILHVLFIYLSIKVF